MCWRLGREWGLDAPATRPQRYCDSASLVFFSFLQLRGRGISKYFASSISALIFPFIFQSLTPYETRPDTRQSSRGQLGRSSTTRIKKKAALLNDNLSY